jgi:hypothetical protein
MSRRVVAGLDAIGHAARGEKPLTAAKPECKRLHRWM